MHAFFYSATPCFTFIQCLTNMPGSCLKQPVLSCWPPGVLKAQWKSLECFSSGVWLLFTGVAHVEAECDFKWKNILTTFFSWNWPLALDVYREVIELQWSDRLIQLRRLCKIKHKHRVHVVGAWFVIWADSIKTGQATTICFWFFLPSLYLNCSEHVPAAARDAWEGGMEKQMEQFRQIIQKKKKEKKPQTHTQNLDQNASKVSECLFLNQRLHMKVWLSPCISGWSK